MQEMTKNYLNCICCIWDAQRIFPDTFPNKWAKFIFEIE